MLPSLISAQNANQRGVQVHELINVLSVDRIEYYSPYPITG
nr:MAG TPA: hypothetical protein [Bacteriophage sp.]